MTKNINSSVASTAFPPGFPSGKNELAMLISSSPVPNPISPSMAKNSVHGLTLLTRPVASLTKTFGFDMI